MKNILRGVFFSLLLTLSVFGQKVSADLILLNGKVFTGDPDKPSAEAVAVRGGCILAVGSGDEIKKLAGAKTRLIDVRGRVVIPGVNDAHFHFTPDPEGFRLRFETLEPGWAETLRAVEKAAVETPKGQWIFGSIGNVVLSEKSADRFALDRIAPDHPVLLRSYFGHGYIVNSKAMPLLQIAEEEPDPLGGYFERVGNSKKINGRIWGYAEWMPNRILSNRVSDAEAIAELKKLANEAVGYGITSMQIMSSMRVDRFARLLVKADLPIRVRAIPFALTSPAKRDLSEFGMLSKLRFRNEKVTAGGIKWILDGTPFERGAALRKPYNDKPDWKGKLNFPESEIAEMIRESLHFKQQLLLHCAGDRCVEAVLDALERVKNVDWRQKRVRIEHGDGVTGDLIERAEKLGVIVVQNPTHFSIVDIIYSRYSPNTNFFTARSLIDANVRFALGSDGAMNPFLNIMLAAVHPARPTEAITREQAVRAYTSEAAYAEFVETQKGTLTKGKFADLAVLSQDIFTAPIPELPKTQSLLTIVGGKIVYDAGVLNIQRGMPIPAAQQAEKVSPAQKPPNVALINGKWFNGESFDSRIVYSVNGRFTFRKPARVDSALDLAGAWVIPPLAEAHNHNIGSGVEEWDKRAIQKYLADGVFYVKIQGNLPVTDDVRQRLSINRPDSIDAVFAQGSLTGTGGHPIALTENVLLPQGYYPGHTKETLKNFYYFTIDSKADLEKKWSLILINRPDFIKTFLYFSDEFEKRRDDPAYFGQKGLDPRLLPLIVSKARAHNLRVSTHITNAADFHHAVKAGVDEIVHLPTTGSTPIAVEDAKLAAKRRITVITTASLILRLPPRILRKEDLPQALKIQTTNLKILRETGVVLAIGSDNVADSSVKEVEHLSGLGVFDNLTLLKMWTETTAKTIFPRRKIGELKEGYEASFLALEGNPIEDWQNVRKIKLRFKQGFLLTPKGAMSLKLRPNKLIPRRANGEVKKWLAIINGRKRHRDKRSDAFDLNVEMQR